MGVYGLCMSVETTPDDRNDEQRTTAGFSGEINNSDDVFDVVEEYIEEVQNAVTDAETQEIVQNWLDEVSDLGIWHYSFNNQAALLAQMSARDDDRFDDFSGYFAGFYGWMNDHNRHVQEGESGFKIIAPETGAICPECGKGPGYHKKYDYMDCEKAGTDPGTWDIDPNEEWATGIWYFKTVTVFSYEQTKPLDDADEDDVFEPKELETSGDASGILPVLPDVADEYDVDVSLETPDEYRGRATSKGYTRLDGTIHVKNSGNTADVFSVGIHELAHELLHDKNSDLSRKEREVEAECVAYAVCRHFGLDATDSEFYVARWNGDDADTLRGRFDRIRQTAADLIETVEEQR